MRDLVVPPGSVLLLLAWIPYTKMMHLLTGPLNIYTSNLKPVGAALKDVDFESAESFGVDSLAKFTWKSLHAERPEPGSNGTGGRTKVRPKKENQKSNTRMNIGL